SLQGEQVLQKSAAGIGIQNSPDERLNGFVIRSVGIDPARVYLGLVQRLENVGLDALDEAVVFLGTVRLYGPGADQGLVEEAFLVRVGGLFVLKYHAVGLIHLVPTRQALGPCRRHFREHVQTGADVFTALGVVRRAGGQRPRPVRLPLLEKA